MRRFTGGVQWPGAVRPGPPEPPAPRSQVGQINRVDDDPIDECVLFDRAGVGGSASERLAVRLAGPSDVLVGERCKRHQLDGVDLDRAEPDPVAPPLRLAGTAGSRMITAALPGADKGVQRS